MENGIYGRHVHKWHVVDRTRLEIGEGGFVLCECGEQQFLTEHELTEFIRQRELGIQPAIDDEGLASFHPRES